VLIAGEVSGAAPGSNVVNPHNSHSTQGGYWGKCPVKA
jgi:hypothetical protein